MRTFCIIVGLFRVKLHVQSLNRELTQIKREINLVQSDIKVLQAEWSYLSSPKRFANLMEKHLKNNSLVLTSQVKNLDSLNGRSVLAKLKTHNNN